MTSQIIKFVTRVSEMHQKTQNIFDIELKQARITVSEHNKDHALQPT